MPFYAVAVGERPGIYNTWPEAERLVKGFPNARYKKFTSRDEAQEFIHVHGNTIRGGSGSIVGSGSVGRKREREEEDDEAPRARHARPRPSLPPPPPMHHQPLSRQVPLHQRTGALVCFTDGSCIDNGKPRARGGWASIWPNAPQYTSSGPLSGPNQTNNRAEYQAALEALRGARRQDPSGIETLFICTDSQLLINSITKWLPAWIKAGWRKSDGELVANRDLLEEIVREQGRRRVQWVKIEAHTNRKDFDSTWNDEADQRCKQEARQGRR